MSKKKNAFKVWFEQKNEHSEINTPLLKKNTIKAAHFVAQVGLEFYLSFHY